MRVRDLDGRTWRVGRRWLPWRRRIRDAPAIDPTNFGDLGDDPLSIAVLLLLGVVAMFVLPLLLLVIGVILELSLLVAFLPVVILFRVALRRPWVVNVVDPDGKISHVERVVGWRASGARVAVLAAGLRDYRVGSDLPT
jgi:hypothetical protein